ncbi:MAG: DEAD/DEAH box helicase [Caldilineaceae bacterium]|nr:DEAD/DEAH box helicase [Caldilineaceae bacterium]
MCATNHRAESATWLNTVKEFTFDPRIIAGIQAAGFVTPTPIQQQAIPVILKNRDILGLAQTGTGKTAAFVLPILQRLTRGALRQGRVLILAPTRELAEQIHQAITQLAQKTKIRSVTIYGGVSKGPQIGALRRGVDIIVACPGRLLDLIEDGFVDLSRLEVLVLDEADRMCDMGFLPDIRRILRALPATRQTLFFSATMPDDIRTLASEILQTPVTVQIGAIAPAPTVAHVLYPVTDNLKKSLLLALLERTATGRVLIFTRTKHRARNLANDLAHTGFRAAALQGNMAQNQRQQAINGFRDGRYDIMVATDIAARGIDVADISHVINFDMPDTVDAYTHRIGRTGRAHQTGEAFTLAVPGDALMVRDIEKLLDSELERRRLAAFDYGAFDPERQFYLRQLPQQRPEGPHRQTRRRPQPTTGHSHQHGARKQASHAESRLSPALESDPVSMQTGAHASYERRGTASRRWKKRRSATSRARAE